jgi:hypothetical protein
MGNSLKCNSNQNSKPSRNNDKRLSVIINTTERSMIHKTAIEITPNGTETKD